MIMSTFLTVAALLGLLFVGIYGNSDVERHKFRQLAENMRPSNSSLWTKGEVPPVKKVGMGVSYQEPVFAKLQKRGFHPKVIVDGGANQGEWSTTVRMVYPDAAVYMIEGSQFHKEKLLSTGNWFAIALLDKEEHEVQFFEGKGTGTGNSVFKENTVHFENISPHKKMTSTLDNLFANIPKVDFLKLDIQGSELNALRGAKRLLPSVDIVLLELALIKYNKGAPTALDVMCFMKENGFELFDIIGMQRSPKMGVAIGFDGFFVNKKSDIYKKFSYEDTLFVFN